MSERAVDAFASVVGVRRGIAGGRAINRELTDLDRAREIAPLVADSLLCSDMVQATVTLRRQAGALGVDVVRARVLAGIDDEELDVCLTLLFSADALIAAVELDADGQTVLLRPDAPTRWR